VPTAGNGKIYAMSMKPRKVIDDRSERVQMAMTYAALASPKVVKPANLSGKTLSTLVIRGNPVLELSMPCRKEFSIFHLFWSIHRLNIKRLDTVIIR
jgi:hypothetical protein